MWADESERTYQTAIERLRAAPSTAEAKVIYDAEYFPLACARMRAQAVPCRALILTVGGQPYSVALSLLRSPAEHIWAIHTPESLPSVIEAIRLAGIDEARVTRRKVDKASAVDVYREIRNAIDALGGVAARSSMVINITSGTKAMTAAASSAAGVFAVPQIYIASDRVVDSLYANEQVHLVEHPLEVLGDPRRREGEQAFADRRYDLAETCFQDLDDAGAPDFCFGARALLCAAYRAADGLRFTEAGDLLARVVDKLSKVKKDNVRLEPLKDVLVIERLRAQAEAAHVLAIALTGKDKVRVVDDPRLTNLLERWLLSNARRRSAREPDLGALLLYRALELAVQRRLAVHGIDTSKLVLSDQDTTLATYNGLAEHRLERFPSKVGLDVGYTLLRALGDPVIAAINVHPRKLESGLTSRNESVFAHGFRALSETKVAEFRSVVTTITTAVARADELDLPEPDPEIDPVALF